MCTMAVDWLNIRPTRGQCSEVMIREEASIALSRDRRHALIDWI